MWTYLLLACGSPEPAPPPAAPPPTAPVPAVPAPPPPHGATPPPHGAPPSLGVFQGVIREQHVADGVQFVRLEGCEGSLWAAGTPLPLADGSTLVTLGGEERPAEIPGVSGKPTVRFVARMAPAAQPLDCSLEASTGFPHVGKVLQSHDAAGYTYAEVAYCDRVAWIAGPQAALTKGGLVGHAEGTNQKGFQSKSLGRSFASIDFVPAMEAVAGDELPCDAP